MDRKKTTSGYFAVNGQAFRGMSGKVYAFNRSGGRLSLDEVATGRRHVLADPYHAENVRVDFLCGLGAVAVGARLRPFTEGKERV